MERYESCQRCAYKCLSLLPMPISDIPVRSSNLAWSKTFVLLLPVIIYFSLGFFGSFLIGRKYYGNRIDPSMDNNSSWVALKMLNVDSNSPKPNNFLEWKASGNISAAPQYSSIAVYQHFKNAFSICEVDIYGFCEYQMQLVIICGQFLG